MKIAKKYKGWNGPYKLEKFNRVVNENCIVWYPELCPHHMKAPSDCDHYPLSGKDFIDITEKPKENLFYKSISKQILLQKIILWTAIVTLITGLVTLSKLILEKKGNNIVDCSKCLCNCDYEDIIGKSGNKKATFRVVYLTQEKRWLFNSEIRLTDSSLLSENIKNFLPKLPNFDSAIGIICVGTASQEGQDKLREEIRADQRADAILFNVRINEQSTGKELYKLNLGQYRNRKDLNTLETAYQRRVILIGIMQEDGSMNTEELKEALIDALKDSKGLDYKTEEYSKFQFTREN